MQEIYSKLSKEEKFILNTYNDRSNTYSVKDSENKLKIDQDLISQTYDQALQPQPVKVLQTKIFNSSSKPLKSLKHLKPPTPQSRPSNKSRCQTETPPRGKKVIKSRRNSSKSSAKSHNSSKSSCKSSFSRKSRRCSKASNSVKVFDVCKVSNWKYEVNKLIRTAFRHKLLCGKLKDELNKIGGSKVLIEYKKVNIS